MGTLQLQDDVKPQTLSPTLQSPQLPNETKLSIVGIICGMISGVFWGLGGVLVRKVLIQLPPATESFKSIEVSIAISTIHDTVALLCGTLFVLLSYPLKDMKKLLHSKKAFRSICFAGIAAGPVGMTAFNLAIYYSSAAYATTITSVFPIITAILSYLIFKQKLPILSILGILIAVAGSIISAFSPILSSVPTTLRDFPLSVYLAFLCAIAFAVDSILLQKAHEQHPLLSELHSYFLHQSAGVVVLLLIYFSCLSSPMELLSLIFSVTSNIYLLVFAGVATTLSLVGYFKAIQLLTSVYAVSINITYTIWVFVFALMLLNEKFSLPLFFGSLITSAGVLLCLWKGSLNKTQPLESLEPLQEHEADAQA